MVAYQETIPWIDRFYPMPLKAKFINASLRDIGEVLLKRTSTKRSLKVTIQILYMYLYNGENAIKNQDPSAPCTRNGKIEECPVSYRRPPTRSLGANASNVLSMMEECKFRLTSTAITCSILFGPRQLEHGSINKPGGRITTAASLL